MKKVLPVILIFYFSFSVSLWAQEVMPLSLQEALDATLINNKEIVLAKLEEEGATARFRQTNAVFLPQIKVSYTAMSSNNPLNAFGFQLQQQSITPADFNPDLLNNPSNTQNFMTKAEWQQPILNMDMLYMRKAAHEQTAIYALKTRRTREYLTFEVQKAYAQLQLAQQAQLVLEDALKTVNSIFTSTQNRFEKGFLQKSDVLNVQVQVNAMERQFAEAKSNVQNASDYLSVLMDKPTGVVYTVNLIENITVVDSIETKIPENRADFQAMQSAVAAHDMMISSGKMAYLPKLNAFAEYLLNDAEVLGFGSNSYLVGAQLSWTLFNGTTTRNKIEEYRIERNKTAEQLQYQKNQSQVELNKTLRQLQDARFSLLQYETAVSQATEALRILQNRYEQGLVGTNDILQSQTQLAQQKLYQAQAMFTFNTTQAYLQFLTTTSI
jgi:outer membrane protein TolC